MASKLARNPGVWITGGLTVAGSYLYFKVPPTPGKEPSISLQTTAMKSVGGAYSNAGATDTHTPAYGGTKMGQRDSVGLKDGSGTGTPNKTTPLEKDGVGDDQRPAGRQTKTEEKFKQAMLGDKGGK